MFFTWFNYSWYYLWHVIFMCYSYVYYLPLCFTCFQMLRRNCWSRLIRSFILLAQLLPFFTSTTLLRFVSLPWNARKAAFEDRTSSYRLFYRTLHDYCLSLIARLFICHTYWTLSDNISIWYLPDNKDKCYWHLKHVGACQKGWSKVDLCCSLFLFWCHALCLWWHVLVIHVSFILQDLVDINLWGIWWSSGASSEGRVLGQC